MQTQDSVVVVGRMSENVTNGLSRPPPRGVGDRGQEWLRSATGSLWNEVEVSW